MNKCIVLGVDAPLSPATRQAIRTIKELIEPLMSQVRLVLLHVIPVPYISSPTLGMYAGQIQPTTATAEQRQEAEKVLAEVRGTLQEQASTALHIDICIRLGYPLTKFSKWLVRFTRIWWSLAAAAVGRGTARGAFSWEVSRAGFYRVRPVPCWSSLFPTRSSLLTW